MKFYTHNSESLRDSLRRLGFNHVFNRNSRNPLGKAISAGRCTWLGVDAKTRRYFSVDGDVTFKGVHLIDGMIVDKVNECLAADEKEADTIFAAHFAKEIPMILPTMPEGVTEVVFKGKRYKQVTTWVEVKE